MALRNISIASPDWQYATHNGGKVTNDGTTLVVDEYTGGNWADASCFVPIEYIADMILTVDMTFNINGVSNGGNEILMITTGSPQDTYYGAFSGSAPVVVGILTSGNNPPNDDGHVLIYGSNIALPFVINKDSNLTLIMDFKNKAMYLNNDGTIVQQAIPDGTLAGLVNGFKIAARVGGFYGTVVKTIYSKFNIRVDSWANRAKPNFSALETPGDYVKCEYTVNTNGQIGTFANLGTASKPEINLNASSYTVIDGTFFFLFAGYDRSGKKKLIADRNIQQSISYDSISAAGFVDGNIITIGGQKCELRLPSGGVATGDLDNEWDQLISKGTFQNNLVPGDLSTHHVKFPSITSTRSYASSNNIISRGSVSGISYRNDATTSSYAQYNLGFRPVLLVDDVPYVARNPMVIPKYAFRPQHEFVSVSIEVYDDTALQSVPYSLQLEGQEVSAMSSNLTRQIAVDALHEGENIITVHSLFESTLVSVGSILVCKEAARRLSIVRTFTAIEGGHVKSPSIVQLATQVTGPTATNPIINCGTLGSGTLFKIPLSKNTASLGVK